MRPSTVTGIGTHMDTSADAPYLDCAYKLVEYAGKARRKRSEGKVLWPGRKQVFRSYDQDGRIASDVLSVEGDKLEGEPVVQPFMKNGKRLAPAESLLAVRERALAELHRLPPSLRALERSAAEYPVIVSETLHELARKVDLGSDQECGTEAIAAAPVNRKRRTIMIFQNREHAARLLVRQLNEYKNKNPLVLAIPRVPYRWPELLRKHCAETWMSFSFANSVIRCNPNLPSERSMKAERFSLGIIRTGCRV